MEKDKKDNKPRLDSQSKLLTSVIVLHGIICISLSYVLSFLGRDPVVDVSTTLITEIVAPTITFLISHAIENIFQYNKLSFSEPIELIDKERKFRNKDIISDSPN